MRREQNDIGNNYALLFQNGDEKALSFFYHEFYPALVYYSFQIIQSRPIAEDIAAEAFVKTWRMHYKLNSYAGIKAYLYKIVHRDSIEAVSKEQQRTQSYQKTEQPVIADSPFDILVRTEVYRLVHAALKDLPPASRKVIIMHYIDGKTTGQISKELNLHPSTIKTQKKQGLTALKKVFIKPLLLLFYLCVKFFPVSL